MDGAAAYGEDLELARRARQGDQEAVQRFLNRMKCVRRFHVSKNEQLGRPLGADELEDAIQDTLFALWQKLDRYEGRGPLEGWAYRFSYLQILSRIRKLDRRPRLFEDLPEHVLEPAERPLADAFRFERLYLLLERVGPPGSDLIRMKVLEQRTFEEVAEILDIPANTAKTRFYRALAKLRGLFEAHDHEAGQPVETAERTGGDR